MQPVCPSTCAGVPNPLEPAGGEAKEGGPVARCGCTKKNNKLSAIKVSHKGEIKENIYFIPPLLLRETVFGLLGF